MSGDTTNTSRDRNEGLGLLLADVLASDENDRKTLVRYAEDPASLDEAERRAFEARLAEDPSLRDRLAMLRGFDARAAEPEVVEGAADGVIPMVQSKPRERVMAPWIAMAAAAGLVAIALLPLLGDGEDADDSNMAQQEEVVSPPALENPTPQLVVKETPAPAPANLAQQAEPTETAPIAATEPPVIEEIAPEPAVVREEILLAAHYEPVEYRAPADFLARVAPRDTVRGESSSPALVAWVPDHVAHTATPQPTLYWTLDGELPAGHEVGVVVTAESALEPLYEGVHVIDPARPRQQTDLAALGVSLEAGEVYRWSVFVRSAGGDPSADRIAQGWIEYRSPSGSTAARLDAAKVGARAARYAESGYWYDALAMLVESSAAQPESADARERLDGFLAKAGITASPR